MTTYSEATDKAVDTVKQGTRAVAERMEFMATLPSLDFVEPVERYFDYLTKAIELNREIATRWAELVTQLTGTVRDEAIKAGHTVEEQVEGLADKAGEIAHQGKELADQAVEETKEAVDEVGHRAGEVVDEAGDTAEELTDKATDTAEDLADDAADKTEKATGTRSRRRS